MLFDKGKFIDLWASISLFLVGLYNITINCFKQFKYNKSKDYDYEESEDRANSDSADDEKSSLLSKYDRDESK